MNTTVNTREYTFFLDTPNGEPWELETEGMVAKYIIDDSDENTLDELVMRILDTAFVQHGLYSCSSKEELDGKLEKMIRYYC